MYNHKANIRMDAQRDRKEKQWEREREWKRTREKASLTMEPLFFLFWNESIKVTWF
jgi:hypothetical protein